MSNKAIAGKIIEAWKLIGSIPKNGRNPKFNYAFVREEDAADAVRNAFIKVGLSLIPSVEKLERSTIKTNAGGEMQHVIVTMKFTMTDKDTGESDSFIMVGEAADSFDKATYKAITGCTKYAYIKLAMSGAEDNEEEDHGESKKATKQPAKTDVPQQGATFRKEPAPAEAKPAPAAAKPAPAPAPVEKSSPAPKAAAGAASGEVPMMEETGKITAVIPAMKNKPATLTLKPTEGVAIAIHFDPAKIDVPALLKMQGARTDVKVICDISEGTPHLMHIGPADA